MAGSKKLEVQIIGDASSLSKAFGSASKSAGGFGRALGRTAKLAGLALGAAGIGGLAVVLKAGTSEFMEQAKVAAQTGAALKSTGGVANVTAKEIGALAQEQMRLTGVDDELIQSGENLLLTFKNVRNEAGEGNKVFNRATIAALDLAQSGFGSIESASKMMGKALNDPIKGMTALGRAGVTFSDDQKKAIAALVKTGDLLGAQKVILKEVESQVGGSAAAYGKTLPGQLAVLKQSFSNLAGSLVSGLMPAFSRATAAASSFVADLSAAKGWRAKLNIVWEGIQEAGQKITAAIGSAIAGIDWAAAWSRAQGIGAGLAARFREIDWTAVGTSFGDGLANAVATAAGPGQKLAQSVANLARSIDWIGLGKAMGPGLAAALVTAFATIIDPAFWVKNWDLALAAGLAVFGRGIGKLVAPLGRAITGTLGRAWDDGIVAIAVTIEKRAPRIAAAVLAALTRLPGLVTGALGKVLGVVSGAFGKLNKLARLVVTVLGIQAAIQAVAAFAGKVKEWLDRVVAWFRGLPGRIRGALPNPAGLLSGIGSAIVSGLWSGMQSKWESVKGWLSGLGGAIKGLKGPIAEDRRLLNAEGNAIMQGLADGMVAGWMRGAAFLRSLSAESVREITKLQAQLNAITARREAQDRAAAVREAAAALAEARKKKEGIAAAELALARAREDVMVAGLNRQLEKEKALLDRRQSMIQAKLAKIAAAVQRATSRIFAAFDKMTGAHLTPAEIALRDIQARREQEDLAHAVTSAEAALARAREEGDPAAIADAERALAQARENITIAGLQRQADAERQAYEEQRATLRENLEARLGILSTHFEKEGATVAKALAAIKALMLEYGIVLSGGQLVAGAGGGTGSVVPGARAGSIAGSAAVRPIITQVVLDGKIIAESTRKENELYARVNGR